MTDSIAPYNRGGKEQRYAETAPRLARVADVHIYTMHWWDGPRHIQRDGVQYHAIAPRMSMYTRAKGRRSILQAAVFSVACLRLLFTRFDVLEVDHMPYLQLFPLKLIAWMRGKRLIVTWHEVWGRTRWIAYLGPMGRLAWQLERFAMRMPDCILAASDETAMRLEALVPGHVRVIRAPNGIDVDHVAGLTPAGDGTDLVSVARLIRHKRLDLLLECVAQLAAAGMPLRCRIMGDGPEYASLVKLAEGMGVRQLIDFRRDGLSHDDLLAVVKGSRVFVLPSEREGFGMAALEAIACGVPVVTTTTTDNMARHLVARAARGIVCEPTAAAIADAVETALARTDRPDDPDAWLREYDWDTTVAHISEALFAGAGVRDRER